MDQNAKTQIIERLKTANNVLVTVSANPSVDQLAACIGTTLMLNKIGKHATAVFSGEVPSTIEFLQPEQTLEKNTDSLRDFIIALDKTKADKLRYKVEEDFVKIFITPYHTSISDKDLEFSHGDFNVDVVLAIGVKNREEVDQAITAHGRILHDATVVSINDEPYDGDLGAINWQNPEASSLSEMLVELGEALKENVLDEQMANAFLTGIVAKTDRFGNAKAHPNTMNVAGRLMAAGANPQLVAEKLEEVPEVEEEEPTVEATPEEPEEEPAAEPAPEEPKEEPVVAGTLTIAHHTEEKPAEAASNKPETAEDQDVITQIHIDNDGTLRSMEEELNSASGNSQGPTNATPNYVAEPPARSGTLTSNSQPQEPDPSTDPLTLPPVQPSLLSRDKPATTLPSSDSTENQTSQTLSDIENSVGSPHVEASAPETRPLNDYIEDARTEVNKYAEESPQPRADLNAQPVDLNQPQPEEPTAPMMPPRAPADFNLAGNQAPGLNLPNEPTTETTAAPEDPSSPPPVPPPFTPQS